MRRRDALKSIAGATLALGALGEREARAEPAEGDVTYPLGFRQPKVAPGARVEVYGAPSIPFIGHSVALAYGPFELLDVVVANRPQLHPAHRKLFPLWAFSGGHRAFRFTKPLDVAEGVTTRHGSELGIRLVVRNTSGATADFTGSIFGTTLAAPTRAQLKVMRESRCPKCEGVYIRHARTSNGQDGRAREQQWLQCGRCDAGYVGVTG
jgi:hypothetical protein